MLALQRMPSYLAFPAVLALGVSTPAAQGSWDRLPLVAYQSDPALAWDSWRQEVVMVTGYAEGAGSPTGGVGCEIWGRTAAGWVPRAFDGLPQASDVGLAFDRQRGILVRFGGSYTDDTTYEWDGTAWTGLVTANRPLPRRTRAMVYDEMRDEIVLFGGQARGPSNFYDDTWTYDGTDWVAHSPAVRPRARASHGMAYDAGRGRTVLFGGLAPSVSLTSTWEWDGTTWTELMPANSPSPRWQLAMAYDRARGVVVLFSGRSSVTLRDTWEWDGIDWTQRFPVNSPPALSDHSMAYDEVKQRVVLFGGEPRSGQVSGGSSTWEWDGLDWVETPPESPYVPWAQAAWDSDRDVVVVFGSSRSPARDELWEWDGSSWIERRTEVRPPGRWQHRMAYDSGRSRLVLYGGNTGPGGGQNLGDTWEWDGGRWVEHFPSRSPGLQANHAMAYDAARGRTVLLAALPTTGGVETWEWDGVNWTPRSVPGPGLRRYAEMAYDPLRERIVLLGGSGASGETWEWDGSSWTRFSTADRPSPSAVNWMVWHAGEERILAGGGNTGRGDLVYEWDGWRWTPGVALGRRFDWAHALAYHGGTDRIVALPDSGATWEYEHGMRRLAVPGGSPLELELQR